MDLAFVPQKDVLAQERKGWTRIPDCISPDAGWAVLMGRESAPEQYHGSGFTAEYSASKSGRLARLSDIPAIDGRSLTGKVFGDPLIERSALAQKRAASVSVNRPSLPRIVWS